MSTREYPLLECSSRASTRQRRRGTPGYSHGTHTVLTRWALGRQRPAYEMVKTSGMALALPKGYSQGTHRVLTGYSRVQRAYEMEKTSGMALALPTATSHSRNGSWCGGELARGVPTVRHATVLAGG